MPLKRPDPRVRRCWTVYALTAALIPAAASVLLYRIVAVPRLVLAVFTAGWLILMLIVLLVYLPMRYRRARYGVENDRITVISGVYFITRQEMPLSGVRHISVIRGPMERMCGIAFVFISAAGGWLLLEGIPADEADALAARIMSP